MGMMSFIRRYSYDLFYVLHVATSPAIFVAALIHTTEAIVFYIPGFLLLTADMFFRFQDMRRKTIVTDLSAKDGITTLTLSSSSHPAFRTAG